VIYSHIHCFLKWLVANPFMLYAGNAMIILRKRAALGTISGAEDNVDLGALIAALGSTQLTLAPGSVTLASMLNPAGVSYTDAVMSYRRDAELPDVSTAVCANCYHACTIISTLCMLPACTMQDMKTCCACACVLLDACCPSLLMQGSGIAIYFPASVDNLANNYNNLVSFDSPALKDWKAFLDTLYTRTADFKADSSELCR
jgi:hypothetical protein